MIKETMSDCVSLDTNHNFNSSNKFSWRDAVMGEGHCSMCIVSSSGQLQIRQLEWTCLFLITMTLPVAISPLTHLDINIFVGRLDSFLAVDRAGQCTSFWSRWEGNLRRKDSRDTVRSWTIEWCNDCWSLDEIILPEWVTVPKPKDVLWNVVFLWCKIFS